VTAADVVRSFERARSSGSVVAGNLAAVRDVRAEAADIVTITASEGSSVFLQTLTSVLIAREVPGAPDGHEMLGSGPYTVRGFVPGVRVEMAVSPGKAGGMPHITDVVWERFGSGQETLEKLQADPRTLVIDPPAEAFDWAKKDPRFVTASEFSGALAYLALGQTPAETGGRRPFADRRTREAIRLALDVPGLLTAVGPAAGFPASQIVPSGVFGFDPAIPLRTRNLDAARSLLSEAGATGRKATLDATEPNARPAHAIAAQLAEAGLSIDVRILPSAEFKERINGKSDLFLFSWVVGQEAGEALKNFFHTKDTTRGLGLQNRTGFSSPDFDTAIEEALRVGEPSARLPLLKRAIQVLDHELPWIPLFTIRSVRIHPADLKLVFRSDGMLLLSDLTLQGKSDAQDSGSDRP
jgi:peptide/nickel transport system substrate-binding protein